MLFTFRTVDKFYSFNLFTYQQFFSLLDQLFAKFMNIIQVFLVFSTELAQ